MSAITLMLRDEAATGRLAARIAAGARARDTIALSGPLGSGKTSFARAFIRALGRGDEEVPSPTFTLVETYALPGRPPIWHFDLYRLEAPEEVYELGIEDAWAEGVSLIEWPERIAVLLPEQRLSLALAAGAAPEGRVATLSGAARWRELIAGAGDG
ncbi:MAG TPA: tRNA (adenosine(37)-N6)-threonylcarbamoyltransferase complex ATPase subunit type 1 TsaE [Stellaceae bacterium]